MSYDFFQRTVQPSSTFIYGRRFYLHIRDLLPEIRESPTLLENMECMLTKSACEAIKEYTESIDSISRMCDCVNCRGRWETRCEIGDEDISHAREGEYCSVLLVEVICDIINLSSRSILPPGLTIYPTHSGMEQLYWTRLDNRSPPDRDYLSQLIGCCSGNHTLLQAPSLYIGRRVRDRQVAGMPDTSAVAVDGLCFFSSCLPKITTDANRAFSVYIVPGRIQWNDHMYSFVEDTSDMFESYEGRPYSATSARKISQYDGLGDSSLSDLEAKLAVSEVAWNSSSLVATWLVASQKSAGFFIIGPRDISQKICLAHTAGRCDESHDTSTKSMNGFRSLVVEGEGLVCDSDLREIRGEPIVRFLGRNKLAVWVALAQEDHLGEALKLRSALCFRGASVCGVALLEGLIWLPQITGEFRHTKRLCVSLAKMVYETLLGSFLTASQRSCLTIDTKRVKEVCQPVSYGALRYAYSRRGIYYSKISKSLIYLNNISI